MASVASRESYFEAGLDVLSDLGYGGLKLAEVCHRLGVTTGSFYHHFSSRRAYTSELVAHWMRARTIQVVEAVRAEPDPRRRIDTLIQVGPTRDTDALEWIAGQLLYALDSGSFATVPDGE